MAQCVSEISVACKTYRNRVWSRTAPVFPSRSHPGSDIQTQIFVSKTAFHHSQTRISGPYTCNADSESSRAGTPHRVHSFPNPPPYGSFASLVPLMPPFFASFPNTRRSRALRSPIESMFRHPQKQIISGVYSLEVSFFSSDQ